MELVDIWRVGGCARRVNTLGILFGSYETEEIIPMRANTKCQKDPKRVINVPPKDCNLYDCPHYRVGTLGMRISWDKRGARM